MSKKAKELLKYRQIGVNRDVDDTDSIIRNLEHAWNNLPEDICDEERTFFLDLVEKLAKMHHRIALSSESNDFEKN